MRGPTADYVLTSTLRKHRRSLSFCVLFLLLLSIAFGCSRPDGGDAVGASNPALTQPVGMAVDGKDVPALSAGFPLPDEAADAIEVKNTSDTSVTIPGYPGDGNVYGSGVNNGGILTLTSTAQSKSAAIYSHRMDYGTSRYFPYLAPYRITINMNVSGECWLAFPDYVRERWKFAPRAFTGGPQTVEVGLDSDASTYLGVFRCALIVAGGSSATIQSIELIYPDVPLAGEPVHCKLMMPMRDGTGLATDIMLPGLESAPEEKLEYPVYLIRSPYPKPNLDSGLAWLNYFKVVYIIQYFRGQTGDSRAWPDSEGEPRIFRDHTGPDNFDGLDTLDWIEGRSWFGDTIMQAGGSALALNGYQMVMEGGEQIDGFYFHVGSADLGDWGGLVKGCLHQRIIDWAYGQGIHPKIVEEALDNATNQAYWDQYDFNVNVANARAPGYHECGWFDAGINETVRTWQELLHNGGPGAAGNQWLVMPPGGHGTRMHQIGALTFPSDGSLNDPFAIPFQWEGGYFVNQVLGIPDHSGYEEPENNALLYLIGENGNTAFPNNRYFEFDDWPPADVAPTDYYLGSSGGLSPFVPLLSGAASVAVNPHAPLWEFMSHDLRPWDMQPYSGHPGYVEFATAPLPARTTIAGLPQVTVYVSTDAADCDIIASLYDQYPDGRKVRASIQACKLSWYLDQQGIEFKPGEVYEVSFGLEHRLWNFEAGHRIGVAVQGTATPFYYVNPGTGDYFMSDAKNPQPYIFEIHYGDTAQSRVTLPLWTPTP